MSGEVKNEGKNVAKCDTCGTLRTDPGLIGQRCYLVREEGGPGCQGRYEAWPNLDTPVCPSCGADPMRVRARDYAFSNGLLVAALFCADCRKAFGGGFMGRQQPGVIRP